MLLLLFFYIDDKLKSSGYGTITIEFIKSKVDLNRDIRVQNKQDIQTKI